LTSGLEPFYRLTENGDLVPTPLAAGPPWMPSLQHGSMVTALLARAIEAAPSAAPMRLARLTVELARAVPMGPTQVEVKATRDGRRLQAFDAHVVVEGEVRARGTALRIRTHDQLVDARHSPAAWPDDVVVVRPEDANAPSPMGPDLLWDAHQARWEDATPGAGRVWLRPRHPLVQGEPITPTVRVAMVADLVMSSGGLLPIDDYVVINPDLTLALTRLPAGEWVSLRSRVRLGADGLGQSEGALFDEHGFFGRVLKSLLVDRR